jgi:hypothetical protein
MLDNPKLAFADEALARYQVSYEPGSRRFASVSELERVETPYQSPQPPLWDWDPENGCRSSAQRPTLRGSRVRPISAGSCRADGR